ncbi:MAG: c-type cytochrome, partial [Bacteroidota bacterium]
VTADLEKIVTTSQSAVGRLHALWTLDGLNALSESIIRKALQDSEAGVRENAIRLAELYWEEFPKLKSALLALQNDPDAKVRFQLLCSLGSLDNPKAQSVSVKMLASDISDKWVQYAALSSPQGNQHWLTFAKQHFTNNLGEAEASFVQKLGALVGLSGNSSEIAKVIQTANQESSDWHATLMQGVAQGIKYAENTPRLLAGKRVLLKNIRSDCAPTLRQASLSLLTSLGDLPAQETNSALQRAQQAINSNSASDDWRQDALTFLGIADPNRFQNQFLSTLNPQYSSNLQNEALQMLRRTEGVAPCQSLLTRWASFTPQVRENAVNVFLTEPERTHLLLAAVEQNQIDQSTVGWRRTVHLMNHDDDSIRTAARRVFTGKNTNETQLGQYQAYLANSGNIENGQTVFQQSCATCHQMKGQGGN